MTDSLFDIAKVKAEVSLVEIIKAAGIDLKKRGADYWGKCPFHAEKSASFSVFKKQGKDFYKCFGCGAAGDVITFMEEWHGLSTFEALKELTCSHNVQKTRKVLPAPRGMGADTLDEEEARRAKRKLDAAADIWAQAAPEGTFAREHKAPVLAYLEARGIDMRKLGGVPASLRFHPSCEYVDDNGEISKHPAMIGFICGAKRQLIAVHRTYLKPDFTGKADVARAKKVLGSFAGGFIPLYPVTGGELNIAEGIETALSVRMHHAAGGLWTCIALDNLKNIAIPAHVDVVNIWADNDMADPAEGKRDLRQQIRDVAAKFKAQKAGRKVNIHWPPKGKDFNDVVAQINSRNGAGVS